MPLPTLETARDIRPESIRTPAGMTELLALRSSHGKHFQHAERTADGHALVTYEARLSPVCYTSDEGELRTIDTTVRDLGEGVIGVEWAPYRMHLHQTGIGFTFHSREGGTVTLTLTGIDGTKFDTDQPVTPTITDNVITFHDVQPGLDIVFRCLNDRVKTLRILHDERAPKTFEWTCESDRPDLIDSTLTGTDAAGNRLDLTATVEGNTITETWTGETQAKTPAVYPVEIDPTVTAYPVVGADDGMETGGAWYDSGNEATFGYYAGIPYHFGCRFPGIAIAQGTTLDSATLSVTANTAYGTGGVGTAYGWKTAHPSAFDNTNRPSVVPRTTATTSIAAMTAGGHSYDVLTILQELINQGSFVSGNAVALMILATGSGTNASEIRTLNAGSNYASLSATYTPGSASTAPNLLLLGCG